MNKQDQDLPHSPPAQADAPHGHSGVVAKHTPGPLRYGFGQTHDRKYLDVYAANYKTVATLYIGDLSRETQEANARLFVCAADLLAALQHCVIERSEWLEEARAAIAKATGAAS